jgi:pyruvate kinase
VGIRELVRSHGGDIPIIAKIEHPDSVANLDAILDVANGAMVARGDLGVLLPVAEVPLLQKQVIRATVLRGKPCITATQMLDSMERNARPTRAEASDVVGAIFDGTSAVMLSGETARGRYPVESVRTMSDLARRAESVLDQYGELQRLTMPPSQSVTEAIAEAAVGLARELTAAAIVCLTESGATARFVAKYRPPCPILAVTPSRRVQRRLMLSWGMTPLVCADRDDRQQELFAIAEAKRRGMARPGDFVIATAGRAGAPGSTDLIQVLPVA